ncbi:MAG: hypothetical protein ABI665_11035 [Vicinamibacterales bacterium]
MLQLSFITLITLAVTSLAQPATLRLNFTPASGKFNDATKQYQSIWDAEGRRMVEAMEQVSGLKFQETDVRAIVYEGVSDSGFADRPMRLRASYPEGVKKATLVHELGHRLNIQVRRRPKELDEHRVLFLYLYDVWTKLYGKEFAGEMVEVEKKRKGIYDYESAWQWALSLSEAERAAKFKEVVKMNLSGRK